MKNDLQSRYLSNRVSTYASKSDGIHKWRTDNLAIREIDTLEQLLRLSGHQHLGSLFNRSILDLGCGDQFIGPCIQDRGGDYYPIDYEDADFNVDPLPFHDDQFDLVISLAVIEHISEVSNYMAEVCRVLKPGGVLYLTTPNFRFCYKSFYDDPTHVKPYTDISIKRLLDLWGFIDVATFPGVRCKHNWFYKGKWRFTKCAYLPFRSHRRYIPEFFSGRSTSVIAIGKKEETKNLA